MKLAISNFRFPIEGDVKIQNLGLRIQNSKH
jgi:hypothetical protein